MNIDEFVHIAQNQGVELGKNPARTIRYYIDLGILRRPKIEQKGKVRRAVYTEEHLVQLMLISELKNEGRSLKEIKKRINESLYWSDEGLEFIAPFIKAKRFHPMSSERENQLQKLKYYHFFYI